MGIFLLGWLGHGDEDMQDESDVRRVQGAKWPGLAKGAKSLWNCAVLRILGLERN